MSEEKLVSLRQKIEGVDEFLRGEVAAWRRGSKVIGIVGVIVVLFIVIYFGWLYATFRGFFGDMEGYLEPRTLASIVQEQVSPQLPIFIETTEKYLLENSADLIEDGKNQLLNELPAGRKALEEYLLEQGPRLIEEQKAKLLEQMPQIRARTVRYVEDNAGSLLSKSEDALLDQIPRVRLAIEIQIGDYAALLFREIREHVDEIVPQVIEKNEEEIRKTFEELADPEAVNELKESLKIRINEMINEQVGEDLDSYLEILKDINVKLAKLRQPELTEEQRLEKEFIANLKELMYRKFETLREQPPIEIIPLKLEETG